MTTKLTAAFCALLFSTAFANEIKDINHDILMRNTLKNARQGIPAQPLSTLVLERTAE
jgi:hypothetical protein